MAARENQGYLIAVIILVLLTLVLGLVAFLGMSKAQEYAEGITNAATNLKAEKKVREAYQIEAEVLRACIGELGESTAEIPTKIQSAKNLGNDNALTEAHKTAIQNIGLRIDQVKEAYDQDMQQFIARSEEESSEDLTWSGVVSNLISVLGVKHNQLAVQRKQNEEDRERLENEKKALGERLAENEKLLTKVTDEFNQEKKRNSEKETQLLTDFQKAQTTVQANSNESSEALQRLRKANTDLTTEKQMLSEQLHNSQKRVALLTDENIDVHDGTIVRVARGSNMVFLDRGSEDGLRTNQTFAVYDRLVNNFEKNQEKAKIEVVRVSPRSAAARITEEDPVNPITRTDLIVTPTWDPGYHVPIAIAGVIDLDGDGYSDRLQFIRTIENNGGVVVAQHDEAGKITGKIDSTTRYLVMGDSPKLSTVGASNSEIYSAIRELEKQAKDHTVQIIDVRKMLNWMGRHNRAKIERSSSKDQVFRPRPSTRESSPAEGSSTR